MLNYSSGNNRLWSKQAEGPASVILGNLLATISLLDIVFDIKFLCLHL